jgi:FkbM family methyltransferase
MLLKLFIVTKIKRFEEYWYKLWIYSSRKFKIPVNTILHGYPTLINFDNTYPINIRLYPNYNYPFIELIELVYRRKNAPINILDIGASLGETMLLALSRCNGKIKYFHCVDGDPDFFNLLKINLSFFPNKDLSLALLSSNNQFEKSLVKIHGGTASSQGEDFKEAISLDYLLKEKSIAIDLIKIDVDGLDGKIIEGGRKTISDYKPAIVFEWHPILCKDTGNNCLDHFRILFSLGYTKFVWFSKYGYFSHFMKDYSEEILDLLASLCIRKIIDADWHYDIIALHEEDNISIIQLAELAYSRNIRT